MVNMVKSPINPDKAAYFYNFEPGCYDILACYDSKADDRSQCIEFKNLELQESQTLTLTATQMPTPTVPSGESFTNAFGMEFVRIPAAGRSFKMGSPETELGRSDDENSHDVTFTQDYYLQVTEMTQDQWYAMVKAVRAAGIANTLNTKPSEFSHCGGDCPVENVSWDDIHEAITAMNQLGQGSYALPTEAQWEYAARAGTISALPTGELTVTDCQIDNNLSPIAWYCANSEVTYTWCEDITDYGGSSCAGTNPVRSMEPNNYGLYDMHGNVTEWCTDWYNDYSTTAQIDPIGPDTGRNRVVRGGNWMRGAAGCRSAARGEFSSDKWALNVGFRLTVSLE
jgi:formylglycine-generating enzyme required for sulfatase activity